MIERFESKRQSRFRREINLFHHIETKLAEKFEYNQINTLCRVQDTNIFQ